MLNRITRFARDYEDEFVKIVVSEKYKQIQLEHERSKKALSRLKGRQSELDILFEQLYEGRTLGTLPENGFLKMSKKYTGEQAELDIKIGELEKLVNDDSDHEMNVGKFLKMVRKYTVVNELTPEIITHFIDKIVVHHREELKMSKTQRVEFYFNFTGYVDIPQTAELKPYKKSFARKKENHTELTA